ncbi:thrombospondin 2/3/4/5 [Sarotherodon galilaeus]
MYGHPETTLSANIKFLWKKFHVWLAGRTNGAHSETVQKLKDIGHTEVDRPEDCDYLLVFCPVVSRVGTDITDALNSKPRGKPAILVVMHHTFDSNCVVAESRRQVDDPHVCLTVDCLFHEGKLLNSNLNEIMWHEVKKFLRVPAIQVISWETFHVWLAGTTNEAHYPIIEMLKRIGQTQVNSPEECDYLLVFCPIVSRVGTDIEEALNNLPCSKPVILVVMHHTFNPHSVVSESKRQVNNPNVHLTVDCLFYEGKLLNCKLNDNIENTLLKLFKLSVYQMILWYLRSLWTWCCITTK